MREADSVVSTAARAASGAAVRTDMAIVRNRSAAVSVQLQTITNLLCDCHSLLCAGQIKRMDMEARSLPADKARSLASKVKEYKADLSSLKEQLRQAAATAGASDAARAELVSVLSRLMGCRMLLGETCY